MGVRVETVVITLSNIPNCTNEPMPLQCAAKSIPALHPRSERLKAKHLPNIHMHYAGVNLPMYPPILTLNIIKHISLSHPFP
jgi:hypothetical protein